jgi:hypothetical protein
MNFDDMFGLEDDSVVHSPSSDTYRGGSGVNDDGFPFQEENQSSYLRFNDDSEYLGLRLQVDESLLPVEYHNFFSFSHFSKSAYIL